MSNEIDLDRVGLHTTLNEDNTALKEVKVFPLYYQFMESIHAAIAEFSGTGFVATHLLGRKHLVC